MTTTSVSSQQRSAPILRPNYVAVGTIVWLGSEVMFFAGIFAIYFTMRSLAPELWAAETTLLSLPFATINTLILVFSSITCQFGVFAAERFLPHRKSWSPKDWGVVEWFALSCALGTLFVMGQIFEYFTLVNEGLTLSSNAYGSIFYMATGFHGLHVVGGLIAFLLVIGRVFAAKTFTHKEATSAIVVSYYWHFVDVVWIGLFAVIYILR